MRIARRSLFVANQHNHDALYQRLLAKSKKIAKSVDRSRGYWNRLFLANLHYEDGERATALRELESASLDGNDFAISFYMILCGELGVTPNSRIFSNTSHHGSSAELGKLHYSALADDEDGIRKAVKRVLERRGSLDSQTVAIATLLRLGDTQRARDAARALISNWKPKVEQLTSLERWEYDVLLPFLASPHEGAIASEIDAAETSEHPPFHLVFAHETITNYYLGLRKYNKARYHKVCGSTRTVLRCLLELACHAGSAPQTPAGKAGRS